MAGYLLTAATKLCAGSCKQQTLPAMLLFCARRHSLTLRRRGSVTEEQELSPRARQEEGQRNVVEVAQQMACLDLRSVSESKEPGHGPHCQHSHKLLGDENWWSKPHPNSIGLQGQTPNHARDQLGSSAVPPTTLVVAALAPP
jgi:hypothetical protein